MSNTYGSNAVVFSVPALTGYYVQSYTQDSKPGLVVIVHNELGQICYKHTDDLIKTCSIEAVFNGATLPVAGATFTYDGILWELLDILVKRDNKGTKTVSLKGQSSEFLTLT